MLAVWCWPSADASAARFKTLYDRDIQQAVDRWWPPFTDCHWTWLKAQLYQESLLNPLAVSPVGAAGLGQFMPGTWGDVSRRLGFEGVSRHSARHSIMAAAFYMRSLRNGWSSPRPEIDRMDLARASYNAGMGNILKAQREAGGAVLYEAIIAALHRVTGHHSRETITYVQRIRRWQGQMALAR